MARKIICNFIFGSNCIFVKHTVTSKQKDHASNRNNYSSVYWQCPPSLRPFDTDEFLSTLERSGPQLTSGIKGDWEGLYRRFFRSPNFEGWYQHRQSEVNQKLQVLHLEALCNAVSTNMLTQRSYNTASMADLHLIIDFHIVLISHVDLLML